MRDGPTSIVDLPRVLEWGPAQSPARLYQWYVDALGTALGQAIRELRSRDATHGARLSNELLGLPGDSLVRVLVAPETYHRLTLDLSRHMPEVMAFIANSVQAERCRLDGNVRCATPVWTALGDAYFPGGFTRYPPSTSTLVYRSDRAFFAPRVKGIIVADFHSMYARAPYASGLGEPASFAPGELLRIFRELDRGFEVIESVARAARDLIALFAKQIVLRKHASVPDVFRAFSLTDYLGRITILNPQLKRWNRFAFADALLHEAMHSFFFALELKEGSFVRSMSTALATKIRSPWTGAELDMYAYVHACLVWFGLFRFWSRATRRRGLPRAQVSAMAAEAGRGFRTQRLTEVPGARDVMRPEIVRAIDAMQRSVTAT